MAKKEIKKENNKEPKHPVKKKAGRPPGDEGGRHGGRQKGTPNKITKGMRDIFSDAWEKYYESGDFKRDLEYLEPQERIVVMEKYAQYITPKMKSVESTTTVKLDANITTHLLSLMTEQ